jgi:hypothetical protein
VFCLPFGMPQENRSRNNCVEQADDKGHVGAEVELGLEISGAEKHYEKKEDGESPSSAAGLVHTGYFPPYIE